MKKCWQTNKLLEIRNYCDRIAANISGRLPPPLVYFVFLIWLF